MIDTNVTVIVMHHLAATVLGRLIVATMIGMMIGAMTIGVLVRRRPGGTMTGGLMMIGVTVGGMIDVILTIAETVTEAGTVVGALDKIRQLRLTVRLSSSLIMALHEPAIS